MKNNGNLLNSQKQIPKLEGKKRKKNVYGKEFRRRRGSKYHRVYVLYMCTAISTVLVVTLLLIFGVGSSNRALADCFKNGGIADKIGDFFSEVDFWGKKNDTRPLTDTSPSKSSTDTQKAASDSPNTDTPPSTNADASFGGLYDYDYSQVPEGHTPIIPMDLSLASYGSGYINNVTGYEPNVLALLNKNLKNGGGYEQLSVSNGPLVLIVHTHGTEAYSADGAISTKDDTDPRTSDTQKNVVSVGKTIADILNQNGIPAAHCTIMHDSIQYKDSYARAEDTIRKYLEEYPTIKLVIDIHRDSIIKSSGEIVRPVTEHNGEAAAQVMCVVGSDWEGDSYPNWEDNLSLALKLREQLNSQCENVCRPVFLKSHTYNQEIAPYSLLLEVGASGNSLQEAQRSAKLIGEALCMIITQI